MSERIITPVPADLPRRIGFWGASAVMVGIIIGSGIFRTPTEIAKQLGSPLYVLLLWAAGGVLSLFGAFTYAELATMYPQSGGVYVFLREGYGKAGRCIAFVFGWTYLLISKPFAAAGIALIFGDNLALLLGLGDAGDSRQFSAKLCTSGALIALTVINVWGVGLSTALAKVLTTLKVAALAAIIVLPLILRKGSFEHFQASAPPTDMPLWLAVVPAMSAILWTYDGWSDVGSMAGEIEKPQKRLPMIYLAGTALVTGLYVAVNGAYIALMPLPEMRATNDVAPMVTERLLGANAAVVVTAIVVISTFGSTHGSILTGARISYAQARDGLLFGVLGRVHPRRQTPDVSLWGQLGLSLIALWGLGSFADLANGFVFTMWIFYGLAGAAIFTLRATRPGAERPYRCWGYPVVPALFVLAAFAMTVLQLWQDVAAWRAAPAEGPGAYPLPIPQTIFWIGVLCAALPVYALWQRAVAKRRV